MVKDCGKGKIFDGSKNKCIRDNQRLVADGNLPNKYWVSISEDSYICKDGYCDWASDVLGEKVDGKTIAVFDTYGEAREFMMSLGMEEIEFGIIVNHKDIYDRLSGELSEETLSKTKVMREEIVSNFHEDLNFTKQRMKELGARFE